MSSSLEKYSDGEPLDITMEGLRTNYKDMKKRFEMAERFVWSKLPDWKRAIISRCKATGGAEGPMGNDRVFNEYSHEIAQLAENEKAILSGDLPPVPEVSTALLTK